MEVVHININIDIDIVMTISFHNLIWSGLYVQNLQIEKTQLKSLMSPMAHRSTWLICNTGKYDFTLFHLNINEIH